MTNKTDNKSASFTTSPLTRTDFVRFAGAGGDFNPVHHDDVYAKAHGFPSVFAMGMLTASIASRLLTDWFGLSEVKSYRVKFVAQVWPGESLSIQGKMLDDLGNPDVVDVELAVTNAAGEQKMIGFATCSRRAS